MTTAAALTRREYELEVDEILAESFPASDPPSWTLGASPWMEDVPPPPLHAPAIADATVRDRASSPGPIRES